MVVLTQQALPGFRIGKWTYGIPEVFSWGDGTALEIGAFCSIARGVKIFLGGEHKSDYVTTYPFHKVWNAARGMDGYGTSKGDVIIGSDVWIGMDARIMSGVTIGSGAVIGVGSVVISNVPPYAIVFGAPAKVLRTRFPAETIEALLQIAWWDWDDSKIEAELPQLMSTDIDNFIVQSYIDSRTHPHHGDP
jgi:acetyltransferase-like isoleucine patch superfamily enzyme